MFLYYVAAPWNLIGRTDPVGGEAGYEQVAARAQDQLQKTGATWIATIGLSHLRDAALVFQRPRARHPDQRARTIPGFWRSRHGPDQGPPGLYVAREPDNRLPLWDLTTAKRQPLERVERVGAGW